jgi:4'-phosphopantetheinyl transferase
MNSAHPLVPDSPAVDSLPAPAMPRVRLNQVKLAPDASLCLLVNTSMLPWPGLQNLESCLSASERRQYAGIAPPEERERRQATRAVLRMVLGQLTGVAAADVGIGKGTYGKPCLAGSRAIGFSVSHSGGFSLLAFARDAEIGCDIEKKQPLEDIRGMSRVALHPEEAEATGALHGRDAEDVFFRHWVRKEAALKAMGTGFSADPARFRVGLEDAEVRLRLVDAGGGSPAAFHLLCTRPAPGYVAAVASPSPTCRWAALAL